MHRIFLILSYSILLSTNSHDIFDQSSRSHSDIQSKHFYDTDEEMHFLRLISEIGKLRQRLENYQSDKLIGKQTGLKSEDSVSLKQSVRSSEENAKWLEHLYSGSRIQVSQNYLFDIQRDADLFEQVNLSNRIATDEVEKIRHAANDLRIKKAHAENRKEAPMSDVKVIILTENKAGIEVPNYQVWFVVEHDLNKTNEYLPFDLYSSPTNRELSPGTYYFWTRTIGSNYKETKPEKRDIGNKAEYKTQLCVE